MSTRDLDEILRVLEEGGIADVAYRLYPVVNIKGMDQAVCTATSGRKRRAP